MLWQKKFFIETKMLSKHFTHNLIFKYYIIILASKLLLFNELILQSSMKLQNMSFKITDMTKRQMLEHFRYSCVAYFCDKSLWSFFFFFSLFLHTCLSVSLFLLLTPLRTSLWKSADFPSLPFQGAICQGVMQTSEMSFI